MTSRWGYHDGMSPEGGWFSPVGCYICFIIPNKPQFGKISMKKQYADPIDKQMNSA